MPHDTTPLGPLPAPVAWPQPAPVAELADPVPAEGGTGIVAAPAPAPTAEAQPVQWPPAQQMAGLEFSWQSISSRDPLATATTVSLQMGEEEEEDDAMLV